MSWRYREELISTGPGTAFDAPILPPDFVSWDALSSCAKTPDDPGVDPSIQADGMVFMDLETTGLGTGPGTLAFLLGLGRLTRGGVQVRQYLIEDPSSEEPCLRSYVEDLLDGSLIVTFNGTRFDLPLLKTRLILSRLNALVEELEEAPTLDLLPVSRTLWGRRQSLAGLGCSLAHLCLGIFGLCRDDDVPGWAIPPIYLEFLRHQDSSVLEPVFMHNALDIVSMALLCSSACSAISRPSRHEAYGAAKLLLKAGRADRALSALLSAVESALGPGGRAPGTAQCLVLATRLLKRRSDWDLLLRILRKAAAAETLGSRTRIFAYEEQAKYHEHVSRDLQTALSLVEAAVELCPVDEWPTYESLLKRRRRLLRKLRSSRPA